VTPEVTPEVTTEVRLLRGMSSALSRRALREAMGLSNDERFRETYLLPALESGLIEMTIPGEREHPFRRNVNTIPAAT
jgi:ATP-dependent DNA helicase RecG